MAGRWVVNAMMEPGFALVADLFAVETVMRVTAAMRVKCIWCSGWSRPAGACDQGDNGGEGELNYQGRVLMCSK